MNKDTLMEMGFPWTEIPNEKETNDEVEYAEDPLTGTLEVMPK